MCGGNAERMKSVLLVVLRFLTNAFVARLLVVDNGVCRDGQLRFDFFFSFAKLEDEEK